MRRGPGKYADLMIRRGRKTTKVAARRLAIRMYWMMRHGWDYQQWRKFGSHAGRPEQAMAFRRKSSH